jgi:hypothetical protein
MPAMTLLLIIQLSIAYLANGACIPQTVDPSAYSYSCLNIDGGAITAKRLHDLVYNDPRTAQIFGSTSGELYLDFDNLVNLTCFDRGLFTHSNWTHLTLTTEGGVTYTNKKVTAFNFNSNRITRLPNDVFNGLYTVTSIVASDNLIETIDEGAFNGLPNLKNIRLDNNQLISLNAGAFSILFLTLQSVELSSNQLTRLPTGLFKNLPELQEVRFHNNPIFTIEPKTFENLPKIELILGIELNCTIDANEFNTANINNTASFLLVPMGNDPSPFSYLCGSDANCTVLDFYHWD